MASTPFKMKGSPMQRNFGIGRKESPMRQYTKSQQAKAYGEGVSARQGAKILGTSEFKYHKMKKDYTRRQAGENPGSGDIFKDVAGAVGKVVSTVTGKIEKAIKPKKKDSTIKTNGKTNGKVTTVSEFKPTVFAGHTGDPYTYRTTASGGFEFSKGGDSWTTAKDQGAIDAIGKLYKEKSKKAPLMKKKKKK